MKKYWYLLLILIITSITTYFFQFKKPSEDKFKAAGYDWSSPKKVEDYFVNDMKMTPEDAHKYAEVGVSFYVTKNSTLDGIINNLTYYGLVRNKNALRCALEDAKDTTYGDSDSIKVGKNGTIDLGIYELSRDMDTWQIADILLNKVQKRGVDPYDYLFMPVIRIPPKETNNLQNN